MSSALNSVIDCKPPPFFLRTCFWLALSCFFGSGFILGFSKSGKKREEFMGLSKIDLAKSSQAVPKYYWGASCCLEIDATLLKRGKTMEV